jgi:hypothetical protein
MLSAVIVGAGILSSLLLMLAQHRKRVREERERTTFIRIARLAVNDERDF